MIFSRASSLRQCLGSPRVALNVPSSREPDRPFQHAHRHTGIRVRAPAYRRPSYLGTQSLEMQRYRCKRSRTYEADPFRPGPRRTVGTAGTAGTAGNPNAPNRDAVRPGLQGSCADVQGPGHCPVLVPGYDLTYLVQEHATLADSLAMQHDVVRALNQFLCSVDIVGVAHRDAGRRRDAHCCYRTEFDWFTD